MANRRLPDRARGASLGESVARLLRRLTWRTPLHSLRLRGRAPLQLTDVPADPIPGRTRAPAGRCCEGRMLFASEAVPLDDLGRRPLQPGLRRPLSKLRLAARSRRRRGA